MCSSGAAMFIAAVTQNVCGMAIVSPYRLSTLVRGLPMHRGPAWVVAFMPANVTAARMWQTSFKSSFANPAPFNIGQDWFLLPNIVYFPPKQRPLSTFRKTKPTIIFKTFLGIDSYYRKPWAISIRKSLDLSVII